MNLDKAYIDLAILAAEVGEPPIPAMVGYSSDKVRRLLNWLCKLEGANYLEIGTHLGSALIPALWENDHAIATCIDNWSMFPEKRQDFEANLEEFLPGRHVNILEGDMYAIDLNLIPHDVNVYFFDGPHDKYAQYRAFGRYDPVFADRFVAVVDDWRWEGPRFGTRDAFADLQYVVEAEWELPSDNQQDTEKWWNRLYVAIVRKPRYKADGY